MKRFFKILSKGFLVIIGLLIFAFSFFRATEYIKGNHFVTYLKNHTVSAKNVHELKFEIMQSDIENSKLILVGEIHGFQDATKFDSKFFSYLRKHFGVEDFLIEMDFAQAHYLNIYNETGDEGLLNKILKNWVVRIGRESSDYKNKFRELRQVYLREGKFKYYGNNNISDIQLVKRFSNDVLNQKFSLASEEKDSIELITFKKGFNFSLIPENQKWLADYVLKNVDYRINDKYREEILTENLIDFYKHYKLEDRKVYGSYGLGHTVLSPFESGYKSMAARFIELKPNLKESILSANFVFLDSKMAINSKALPCFLQDEGQYTNLSVSYDNIFMSYLFGIDDLRRVTTEKSMNLIKLNAETSPYHNSRRLSTMFKILPFGQILNAREDKVTSDYYDYMILVRNSDGIKFD